MSMNMSGLSNEHPVEQSVEAGNRSACGTVISFPGKDEIESQMPVVEDIEQTPVTDDPRDWSRVRKVRCLFSPYDLITR